MFAPKSPKGAKAVTSKVSKTFEVLPDKCLSPRLDKTSEILEISKVALCSNRNLSLNMRVRIIIN